MPYRAEFANSTKFLHTECMRLGVDIKTGKKASTELIREMRPDSLVIATGSLLDRPQIPGAKLPHVYNAEVAITSGVVGPNVVVVDSGEADWRVLTTAENLADKGHNVTLVSPISIAAEIDAFSRPPFLRRLAQAKITCLENHSLISINKQNVEFKHKWSGEKLLLAADNVVLSWFNKANDRLASEFEDHDFDCYLIGDALAPRLAINAIWDGFRVGLEI